MLLRYGDGRPDIPIAPLETTRSSGRGRRQDSASRPPISLPQMPGHRARAGSHGSSPLARSYSRQPDFDRSPPAPEEIRILPSNGSGIPLSSSSSNQPRSRSLPRSVDLRSQPGGFVPPLPTNQGPQVTFSQPEPQPWHPHGGRPYNPQKQPPSIIYAPSHHSRPARYTPPALLQHPPQMGPNGMIYSHSVPPTQFPSKGGVAPYPPMAGQPPHLSSVHEENRGDRSRRQTHERARSLSFARPMAISPSTSTSSLNSQGSGSTYYVLPAAGQKVHVIVSQQLS
ncbi:hypothetical protein BDZ94DRAFT_1244391 [Collybia nuda]|uniref:Uncharacterized protein n=1 Tax=Collybia nuda TaxID=64659 RepID=A0A9P5YGB0_9AGAR|nr:hypothetical protein BDZ94DRAFT_1244391 [Collybia nuda]